MSNAVAPTPPQFQVVDLPELSETFADFVHRIQFDGQTLRLEFCVTRFDDHRPPAPASGKRYPTCRLVLPAAAALDLMNKMQQITAGLIKAGVLKTEQQAAPAGAPS